MEERAVNKLSFFKDEIEKWAKVIQTSGIKPD